MFFGSLHCTALCAMWWRVWTVVVAAVICSFLLPRSQAGAVVGVGEETNNWLSKLHSIW